MKKGQELPLGADDPQECPLGLKAAETSPATDGFEVVIIEIVARYDEAVGRKAQHAMAEISKLVRERAKRTAPADSGRGDK